NTVLRAWEAVLSREKVDLTALRRQHETLGRILASRPSLRDFGNSERIIMKTEILRVLRLRADPSSFITDPPCWREFYSWRVMIAKSLNQAEDFFQTAYGLPIMAQEWHDRLHQDYHFD